MTDWPKEKQPHRGASILVFTCPSFGKLSHLAEREIVLVLKYLPVSLQQQQFFDIRRRHLTLKEKNLSDTKRNMSYSINIVQSCVFKSCAKFKTGYIPPFRLTDKLVDSWASILFSCLPLLWKTVPSCRERNCPCFEISSCKSSTSTVLWYKKTPFNVKDQICVRH